MVFPPQKKLRSNATQTRIGANRKLLLVCYQSLFFRKTLGYQSQYKIAISHKHNGLFHPKLGSVEKYRL